ncbi:hypothetical protein BC938DRAFT_474337 [Jimgerdemannia flammicorona]|uniref:Uncharacterized protein n=1 Tax=Jimgerdemannia flammicorona TaxID=994334 RepID=A0A433Q2B4_9FUNG|nr:hypothetical protein BC938DRAFT_474337 [Jimgerdemannia flammicorona]
MAFVKAVPVQKLEEAKEEEMDEDEDLNFKREEREKAAKKKRNLDSFLEEIKRPSATSGNRPTLMVANIRCFGREQEEREDRLRQKHAKLAGAGVSTGAFYAVLVLMRIFQREDIAHNG